MKFIIFFSLLLFSQQLFSQHNIIPEPFLVEQITGNTTFTKVINIKFKDNILNFEANYLQKLLLNKGFEVVLNQNSDTNSTIINLNIDKKESRRESYALRCENGKINLSAAQNYGIFYAIQTLDQLLPHYTENATIGNCNINDFPTMEWRGLMLDVSRHFFTVDEVKEFVDLMAHYKFNVFHWHLTDDEGWRIEIKSMPKLTEIGAWRAERTGKFRTREAPKADEPKTYGGFYTQEQIKEVITYAKERHITIVPEIDVPGHSMALLAAYPELSTKKEPKMVSCGFKFSEWYGNGKFKMLVENTVNPSDDKVYDVLNKIFTEVAALFPGEYIHIGGDEAYHGYWEADKNCVNFMKVNKLKNTLELQSYFIKRLEKIISSKGKKLIGWDEILYGGLAKGATVMSWQGTKGGIEAAKLGHKVVMTPMQNCYLDYMQGDKSIEETVYDNLTLKKAYEFSVVPEGVDVKLILGGQGNLWTEQVPTLSHAFYMTYPRAFALSEALWSDPKAKNWNNFAKKVDYHFSIFDKLEIPICKAVYDPIIKIYKEAGKVMCSISCETEQTAIYYTLDSTFPDKKSTNYTKPFEIPDTKIILRAITYRDGKPLSRLLHIPKSELYERVKM